VSSGSGTGCVALIDRYRYLSLCPFVGFMWCRPSLYQREACRVDFGMFCAGACAGAQELSRAAPRHVHPRSLLQTAAAPTSGTPATIDVALLSATDAIALLCSRNITSVAYVQALFAHYDNGGFACLNSFITLNRPQVSLSVVSCVVNVRPGKMSADSAATEMWPSEGRKSAACAVM